jgi:hypothetical protein
LIGLLLLRRRPFVFACVELVAVGRDDGAFGSLLGVEDLGGFGEEFAAGSV